MSSRLRYAVRPRAFLIAGTAFVARPPALSAQDAGTPDSSLATESAAYSEAVIAGVHEHEIGHFHEARVHFLRANELYSNARTLRALGKVEFELRNYGESVHYLRGALDSTERPLEDAQRAEVSALLTRASAYVGEVHVVLDPQSAQISVDGVTVATGPKASLSLLVGDHVLEFHALGRK